MSRKLRIRFWLKRVSFVLWCLAATWLALEISFRILFPILPVAVQWSIADVRLAPWGDETLAPMPPFLPDIDYQNILPPGLNDRRLYFSDGSFEISTIRLWGSRVGLRSDPPRSPVDVIVVGDSFSMCYTGFSDCWVNRLNSIEGWNVVNFGQWGTGSRAHLQMLATFGRPLKPRVVIWQWYGNDCNDDYGFALLRGEVESLDMPLESTGKPDLGWLADYSASYALLRDVIWQSRQQIPPTWTTYNRYAFDMHRPANRIGWEMTIEALDQAHHIVDEQIGGKLVILLIPTKEEIQPELVEAAKDPAYVAMLAEGRRRMLQACQERGWHCVDASQALLSQAQAGKAVYFANDPHINVYGNEVVSRLMDNYLKTRIMPDVSRLNRENELMQTQ